MSRICLLAVTALLATASVAQDYDRLERVPAMVVGARNPDLDKGARLLLAGRTEEGVEATLRGLKFAVGTREEEAALSNLCSGYVVLERFDVALGYCEQLLTQNDESWRGYNNRALIYIMIGEFEKANQDLVRAEALNPGAPTIKIAREIYRDAADPVRPLIVIDDTRGP
jgi:tetratricopeptide (TPR) repeat protein